MKGIRSLVLLLGIVFLFTSCQSTSERDVVDDALREQALEKLKTPLADDSLRWEKVHAAEYLLSLQYTDQVQAVFIQEEKSFGDQPMYRIGIWRVLAQAATSAEERAQWVQRIEAVYQDPTAPDRVHAAESLAKLRVPILEPERRQPDTDPILHLFATWAEAYTSKPAASQAQETLLQLVAATERPVRERKLAAYALRHLGTLPDSAWTHLADLALREPATSEARVFMLSAAFVTAPGTSSGRWQPVREALLAAAQSGRKAERYELAVALSEKGTSSEITLLTSLLDATQGGTFSREDVVDMQLAAAYALLRIDRRAEPALTIPDWIVIVLYGAAMLGTGWFYSRQNKTQEDYLLGGRQMNPIAVGISLFATLLSTLSYLSYPGEMIQHGPAIFAGMFAFPFVYYAAGWWLIPRIMQMNVTSAYEILERRFGLSVRLMATFMFLSLRFLWMATIIYVTVDVALLSVVPIDRAYVMPIGILLMLITIVYTAMGGLKAVVVTDVVQSIIFLGGALLSIVVVCFHFGSVTSWFPQQWPTYWDPLRWGFDATERSTVGNAMMMLFVWYICTTGSDQMAIQRYLSTKDIRAARQSLRVSLYTNLLAKCLLGLVGLAVLAFFTKNPHFLSDGRSLQQQADTLFPRFILVGLPAGLSGLVIAGLLAAAMSSLSSGLNSVSSVLSEDIIQRFRRSESSKADLLKQVKRLSYFTGAVVMILSILVARVEGNLFDVVTKIVNLFVGPLFVLFFMALFVPFATTKGTLAGGLAAIAAACGVAFFGMLGITVFWILPVALVAGVGVGTLVSFLENKVGITK
ncbi:hypothetical protein GCM10027275_11120 [Rhabdobacter roseus]|uniref:SSS family solute:Na+ symporter n=1 Tax=Rhabdobacter roseus TaxID=1655419 RepID=A0A840TN93_9BACT|nr:sodium/solute symporter [Rhabdobacter roseus]MBB5283022.1 SSS family solute:Na+ symporter [Rhabdobacter roseus]